MRSSLRTRMNGKHPRKKGLLKLDLEHGEFMFSLLLTKKEMASWELDEAG